MRLQSGTGGDFSIDNYIPVAAWHLWRVEYQDAQWTTAFKIELDGNDLYQSEPSKQPGNQDSPINMVVVYRLTAALILSVPRDARQYRHVRYYPAFQLKDNPFPANCWTHRRNAPRAAPRRRERSIRWTGANVSARRKRTPALR